MAKVLANGYSKGGRRHIIIRRAAGYAVMVEKTNHQHGRDVVRWFTCQVSAKQTHQDFQRMARDGMDLDAAVDLFNRKVIKADQVQRKSRAA